MLHVLRWGRYQSTRSKGTQAEVARVLDRKYPVMTTQEFNDRVAERGCAESINALLSKLGFSADFVATNVFAGVAPVTISRIAMLWQGMPNKHDRKRTRQLFDALSEAGLLVPAGDEETWSPT
jgi:hypothetical protein